MSKAAIGGGLLLLAIIIVVVLLKPWEDSTTAVVDGEEELNTYERSQLELQQQQEEQEQQQEEQEQEQEQLPLCDEFQCPSGKEVKTGERGETEGDCCQKTLCPTDACGEPAEDNFKDPIPGARGDTPEDCCVDALCSVDSCYADFELEPPPSTGQPHLGRSNEQCCQPKPDCFPTGADPSWGNCPDSHTDKTGAKGSSVDECCTVNSCDANLGANGVVAQDKCESKGMTLKTGSERGASVDLCCDMGNCVDDALRTSHPIVCPDGKEVTDDPTVLGNTPSSCCVQKRCFADAGEEAAGVVHNGWDDTRCKFNSFNRKTRKLGSPRGNTVDECCSEKLCSDNFFYDKRSSCYNDDPAAPSSKPPSGSPCFHGGNVNAEYTPGTPPTSEDMKQNCAYYGLKSADSSMLMPFNPDDDVETCCQPLTCQEFSDGEGNGWCYPGDDPEQAHVTAAEDAPDRTTCEGIATAAEWRTISTCPEAEKFMPNKVITYPDDVGADGARNSADFSPTPLDQCCEVATCEDVFSVPGKCKEMGEERLQVPDGAASITIGAEPNEKEVYDADHLKYKSSAPPDTPGSIENCCELKKCSEVDFDCSTLGVSSKMPDKKTTQPPLFASVDNCCEGQKCNTMTADQVERLCYDSHGREPKVTLGSEAATPNNCCQDVTCEDVGWDDNKCKDKRYTRPSVRGKMRKDSDGNPRSIYADDLVLPSYLYGADGQQITGLTRDNSGPEVAEADNGRDIQCCEQDIDNNFARQCVGELWDNGRYTKSSIGSDSSFHLNQIGGTLTAKTPEQCKAACEANDLCTSFKISANVSDKGSPDNSSPECELYKKFRDNQRDDIQYYVNTEWAGSPTRTQYVSGKTFPCLTGDCQRYSGGPPADWTKDVAQAPTQVGNTVSTADVATRTRHEWDHRDKIYLAGVDKEFCPYKYVKGYGIWNNSMWGSGDQGATWHNANTSNADGQAEEDYTEVYTGTPKMHGRSPGHHQGVVDGKVPGTKGSTCYPATDHGPTGLTHNMLYPSEVLDHCYKTENCQWAWMTPSGHKAGEADSQLGYQTRWDPATSKIWQFPAKTTSEDVCTIEGSGQAGITGYKAKRRTCFKGKIDQTSHSRPGFMGDGGASMFMTRIMKDGDPTKAIYGKMPHKINFAQTHVYGRNDWWDPLLITGDDSGPLTE